ncbi:MAG: histidine--tRNA ligase [Methanomicrobiales archaeon]|nr:histidine--tRNA ligase [Methanomicrobiales archaeon]
MLQRPRGTRDFLPEEMERRRCIEATMRKVGRGWGYREVCTPVFEDLELFTLRSGEGIIQEMYTFEDKGGRKQALRPEVTAPVLRLFVNEGRTIPKPIRWYYFCDCFRYERPQKGRYREFWQFGVELIGADSPHAEAETIMVADAALRACGVSFEMKVGHLAPMKHLLSGLELVFQRIVMGYLDKKDFDGLAAYLASIHREDLYDSLMGLIACRNVEDLFSLIDNLPERKRLEKVFALLDQAEVPHTCNFGIARGLDYYTGMVFEGFADNLGAENQIVGGGTYRLAHLFGGEDVGSCGFAIGFDRVMVSLGEMPVPRLVSAGVASTEESRNYAMRVARGFRASGIPTTVDLMERGLGAQLAHLAKEADFALIIGRREQEKGVVTLKNLHTGEQKELPVPAAIDEVKRFGDR